jgi:hypothetical protein
MTVPIQIAKLKPSPHHRHAGHAKVTVTGNSADLLGHFGTIAKSLAANGEWLWRAAKPAIRRCIPSASRSPLERRW